MSTLRILVADDHEIARRGICAMLTHQSGWVVCGEATDGRDAVLKAGQLRPDVIVLDVGMPNLNGIEATRQILEHRAEARVLILTMHDSEQLVSEILKAGARGFVLKSDAGRDLIAAVQALQNNRTFFTSKVAQFVLDSFLNKRQALSGSGDILTSREREIVQLLAEGKSTKDVAYVLNLSVKTAETHRANIMRKLSIHSISELVLWAVRNNVVQLPVLERGKSSAA
jgi:DNA-binding NarL/FixJ family response regulator